MADDFLEKGIAAFKAGNKEEARRLLNIAILSEPDNLNAWLWYYDACETEAEKQRCLNEILRIDPNNEKAKLIKLDFQITALTPETPENTIPLDLPVNKSVGQKHKGFFLNESIVLGLLGFLAVLLVAIIVIGFFRPNNNASSSPALDTETPKLSTATQTPTIKIANPQLSEEEYLAYLTEKFGKVGGHVMAVVNVEITTGFANGKNYHNVVFTIGDDDANFFSGGDTSLDRKLWALRLLNELKNHWPEEEFNGALVWNYYSIGWYPNTECQLSGNELSDKGWEYSVYFATIKYSPASGMKIGCF